MGTHFAKIKCCAGEDGDSSWDKELQMRGESDDLWHGERMPWVEVTPQLYANDMPGGLRGMQGVSCCRADVDDVFFNPFVGHGHGPGPSSSSGGLFTSDPDLAASYASQQLESLSYVPVRFDERTTVDMERSQARYSKIAAHSTRAQTQRRSSGWEEWIKGATAGQPITLLEGFGESVDNESFAKTSAMYYVDRTLTKFWIRPAAKPDVSVAIDYIQVICAATDFMLLLDQVEAKLESDEKDRAIIIQFSDSKEGDDRKRVCFLEESTAAKERFIYSLTALWLEKKNDHSMWF